MKATSVADVNSLFTKQGGTVDRTSSADRTSSDGLSFARCMSDTAGKSVKSDSNSESVKQQKTVVEKTGRKDLKDQTTERTEDTKGTAGKKEKIDRIPQKANEVKEAIINEFDISEEELNAVMETMNISVPDLLNTDVLKELLLQIGGKEDAVTLLTDENLYQKMMNMIDLVSDFTETLQSELDLSDEEFNQIVEAMKQSGETQQKTEITPEREQDRKAPVIEVEINRSEESRVSEGVNAIAETGTRRNGSEQLMSQNRSGNEEEAGQTAQQPQVTQSVETHQIGEVVETVRHFSSYVNGEEIVNQVKDFIKVNISPETTSMELQLHPASLGTVYMNIRSQNGIVTAQLLVQSEAVRESLEAQMLVLKETMEEQGTRVEAVEVAVASYDLDRGPFQDRDDRQERQNADRGRKRINLNLNDTEADDLANLNEEDQLARHVMEMNGTSVDFSA